uniref:Uncharacterized protein n=1 Tax=Anguilla anguilla TaxID=7936 RepID=A0A0E9Q4J3_ANGAN
MGNLLCKVPVSYSKWQGFFFPDSLPCFLIWFKTARQTFHCFT